MNAFRFDEARALTGAIEAAERARVRLAAALSPSEPEVPRPFTVARLRRRRAR
jgi:hypothetical protein